MIVLLLLGFIAAFIAGACFEACRPGGSIDQYQQRRHLDQQRARLIRLYVDATNPHKVPAQRQVPRA